MAVVELEIPARTAYLSLVRLVVDAALDALGTDLQRSRVDDLKLAVTEACSNAIEAHASSFAAGPVIVRCAVDAGGVTVDVVDRGGGFDPSAQPALPAVSDPRRLKHESGLGLVLMRTLADDVRFLASSEGTTVRLAVHATPNASGGT